MPPENQNPEAMVNVDEILHLLGEKEVRIYQLQRNIEILTQRLNQLIPKKDEVKLHAVEKQEASSVGSQ